MPKASHAQIARDFLAKSIEEFAAGDNLQASEKLWGATTHAIKAVADRRGLKCNSHKAYRAVINQLTDSPDYQLLRLGFSAAEMFHGNFYNNFMAAETIDESRPDVENIVRLLLHLAEPQESADPAGVNA